MHKESHHSVTIWDAVGQSEASNTAVLWNGFTADSNSTVVSLQECVESNSDVLRKIYLAYIYELGDKCVGDQSTVDHLKIRGHFSFWWMTLLVEKCNFAKSPQIDDAIKLLAMEKWLDEHQVTQIELVSKKDELAECLETWCRSHNIQFSWNKTKCDKSNQISLVRQIYNKLPLSLQAIIWLLRHLVTRWPLIGAGVSEWRESTATTAFVSYFFNLVPDAAQQGQYVSRYWAHLPDMLAQHNQPTRWLHIWVKDQVAPTAKKTRQLIRAFIQEAKNQQIHVMLDSFLGWRPVWKTLKDWVALVWSSRKLEAVLANSNSTKMDLWPLFRRDWQRSIRGSEAISNLLMFNLFEAAFADIPRQQKGLYLQENQGWEFGCIAAWDRERHQGLIGVPHSTVRYWDLRYFFDSRCYQRSGQYDLPMPEQVAVNGPVAQDMYLKSGYPSNQLVEVEALRYLHLTDSSQKDPRDEARQKLLVLGDYLLENTKQQMELFDGAIEGLSQWEITIKPHPACPIDLNDYPALCSLGATVSMQPIAELLAHHHVAYTSAVTSAAVDAYSAGLLVISVLDPESLNLSPLRGIDGVQFVGTSGELVVAMQTDGVTKNTKAFFNLDTDLPRWRELLEVEGVQN